MQGPVSVHVHRAKGVTGSEGREGTNEVGVGGGMRVGGGNGNGDGNGGGGDNGDVNGYEHGDGARTATRTGLEAYERMQDGNRDGGEDPWTNTG